MVHSTQAPGAELDSVLARCNAGAHLVQFYEEEAFLLDVVGQFVAEGLRADAPCLVIATQAHREGVLARLQASGVDVEAMRTSGRLVLLDARETLAKFLVDGVPDASRFHALFAPVLTGLARLGAGARVRAYGEMVDLLWQDGHPEAALRLEQAWNDLGSRHAFTLLCAYVMGNFVTGEDGPSFQAVCRAHSHVVPSEGYSRIDSDDVRLRRISELEQRAKALEHEVEHRKRVERELLAALHTREDFLAVAGHELKTPLTAMQLQMDTLLALAGKGEEPEVTERVQRLRKQARRLGSLVEDLLDVSRLSAGRFKLEPDRVDLSVIAREVADRFKESAERSGCHLRVLAQEALFGEWDRIRIEQVLTNLLSNALKYGAGHPIEVMAAGTHDRARLLVRDGGVGIPLPDQARIFQRFDRASASRNYGGLGLGLWIARQIIEAHGGTIRVESEPGDGATFLIELPRVFSH